MTDEADNPTLWHGVLYNQFELENLQSQLVRVYELLVADGDKIPFLKIASIEFCSFGNSKPFRIKVVNELNDNHDYFYIKRGDASRVYGLELEEIFSPDKISFLVQGETLIEEHHEDDHSLDELVSSITSDVIEVIKEEVKVQQWKIKEEERKMLRSKL